MAETEDNAGVRVFPPAVFFVAWGIGFGLRYLWPAGVVSESLKGTGHSAGMVVMVAGALLTIWTLGLFARAKTNINPTKPATTLVIQGPYLYSRNPMYLGWVVFSVGLALVANSIWLLVMVIPAIYVIRRTAIDREEKYLAVRFGEEYRAYCARVRRWI